MAQDGCCSAGIFIRLTSEVSVPCTYPRHRWWSDITVLVSKNGGSVIRPSGAPLSIIAPDIVQSIRQDGLSQQVGGCQISTWCSFQPQRQANRDTKVSVSRTRLYRQIRCVGSLIGVHSAHLGTVLRASCTYW